MKSFDNTSGGTSINPVIDPGEEFTTMKISTTTWNTERKTDLTTGILDITISQGFMHF